MRLKRRPWASALYENNPDFYLKFPESQKGHWNELFLHPAVIELEIGAGKGGFIIELAQRNPEKNYIAMEINEMALAYLLRKQVANPLPNLLLVIGNARDLEYYFAPGEIANIYLNFSDPWPKKKHAKRRLMAPDFLKKYQNILPNGGKIHFKTDNEALFVYSLKAVANEPYLWLDQLTFDLHHSEYNQTNILTEYEQKFSQKGSRIYMLETQYRKGEENNHGRV